MRIFSLITLLAVSLSLPLTASATSIRVMTYEEIISDAMNVFTYAMYEQIIQEEEGNVFFSPYSMYTALTMTELGAAGTTAEEMDMVLGLDLFEDGLGDARRLVADIGFSLEASAGDEGYELSVANRLWGQAGYGFMEEFTSGVQDIFHAGLEELDFAGDTEGSRQVINQWVEDKTRERIQELLKPGILTPLTRLVLTNAIYFKGEWTTPFDPDLTTEETFHADGSDVTVPMMHGTLNVPYGEFDWGQAVLLPYGGERLGMVVMLPREGAGFDELEADLAYRRLHVIWSDLYGSQVKVSLPRWKNTLRLDLNQKLADMGMPTAFTQGAADFSPINGGHDLYITAVVHKAFIEVNEEGSEAAAATAVVVGTRSVSPVEPAVFRADRPFLYAIVDTVTGTPLFFGRLMDPTDSGE